MSNYTKTTDFEAKDSLPTGDSGKIIRGADFETEFDAISTAIATKADTAGPTFTGTATFATISDGTIAVTAFVDEDDMSSDSATLVPTQQSVKAYVDSVTTELQAQDLDFQADSGGALTIDLDTETMTFTGGVGIDTTGSGNDVSFAIDSTVTTLTGTQTLTNKTLTSPDIDTPDIDGGTIDGTVIGGTTPAAVSATTVSATGNITVDGTVDGRDIATDGTKLDNVEANADVTDTANVTAAGALMDSEVTNLDQVKAFDSSDYATAAQGTTADNALPKTGGAMTGAITTNSTFDGRDVATDGIKLDGIEALADVTDTTNVTAAGALMDSELTNLTAVKSLDQGVATTDTPTFAGLATSADVSFGDNDKAIFGAGSDLQIYHDASNSRILENGTGFLAIGTNGGEISLRGDSFNDYMLKAEQNSAVTLYHNALPKLATTSTGIDVTGSVVSDGLTVDGDTKINSAAPKLTFLESDTTDLNTRLRIAVGLFQYHTANDAEDTFTRRLQIDNSTGDISFYEDTGTTAKFFWDASAERLELTNLKLYSDNVRNEGGILYIGTSGNHATQFYNNDANTVHISGAGNVGIGTSSPVTLLNTKGATLTATTDKREILIEAHGDGVNNSQGALTGITFRNSPTTYTAGSFNRTSGVYGLNEDSAGYGRSMGLAFYTATNDATAAERMRIDSSGQVGIGTSSPSRQLTVQNSGNAIVAITSGTSSSSFLLMGDTDSDNIGMLKYNNADNSLGFYAGSNSSERMHIDSAGNVGIGTAPSTKLHVYTSAGRDFKVDQGTANKTILSNDYGLTLKAGAGYNLDLDTGNASGAIRFLDNGSEAMRIDSSGNVGIGTSSPSTYNAQLASFKDGGSFAYLGHNNSGGTFPKVSALSFGSNAVSYTHTTDGGTNALSGSAQIAAIQSASSNAVTDMAFYTTSGGSVTERMRIDSSGHVIAPNGVTLGTAVGTYAAANTLDDYEEGTFTPVMTGVSGWDSSEVGYYTKVGNLVTVMIYFSSNSALTGTPVNTITGLPFSNNVSERASNVSVSRMFGIDLTTTDYIAGVSSTEIVFSYVNGDNNTNNFTHSGSTLRFTVSATYFTA